MTRPTLTHRSLLGFFILSLIINGISCAERHPLEPRVPEHKMEEAKSWKAPFGEARTAQPEIVAEGKKLYEGKGSCFMCHGVDGKGNGPAAHMQRPHPPRDFTDCTIQNARTDGELFWTIKHGIPGTGMAPLIPALLKDEEGWKIIAYVRTFCRA